MSTARWRQEQLHASVPRGEVPETVDAHRQSPGSWETGVWTPRSLKGQPDVPEVFCQESVIFASSGNDCKRERGRAFVRVLLRGGLLSAGKGRKRLYGNLEPKQTCLP